MQKIFDKEITEVKCFYYLKFEIEQLQQIFDIYKESQNYVVQVKNTQSLKSLLKSILQQLQSFDEDRLNIRIVSVEDLDFDIAQYKQYNNVALLSIYPIWKGQIRLDTSLLNLQVDFDY